MAAKFKSDLNAINDLDLTSNIVYFGSYKVKVPEIILTFNEVIFKCVRPHIDYRSSPESNLDINRSYKLNITIPLRDVKTMSVTSKNWTNIYMIFDLILEAVTKIQTSLGLDDFRCLHRYTGEDDGQ